MSLTTDKQKEYNKKYISEHKAKRRVWEKAYYKRNRERLKEYREGRKEEINKYAKAYYKLHREEILEKANRYNEERKEYLKKYRIENRTRLLQRAKQIRDDLRKTILNLLGNKCCKCGFDDTRAIQIDHVNGNGIEDRDSLYASTYYRKVIKSIEKDEGKYQLLCSNCNWIKRVENEELPYRSFQ